MCFLASKQACQDRFLFTFPLTGVQGSEINPGVWDKPVLSPPPLQDLQLTHKSNKTDSA